MKKGTEMRTMKLISKGSHYLCVALPVSVCLGASMHPVVAFAGEGAGLRTGKLPETGDIIAMVVLVIATIAALALLISLISKRLKKQNNNAWKYPF